MILRRTLPFKDRDAGRSAIAAARWFAPPVALWQGTRSRQRQQVVQKDREIRHPDAIGVARISVPPATARADNSPAAPERRLPPMKVKA